MTGAYNLIGPGGSGGITGPTNIVMTTLAGLDLAPLADFGGPTQTMALETGSLAIAHGSSTITGVTIPSTDERGFPLDTPTADIGADQASAFPLVVSLATDGSGAPAGELDLRAAVNVANISPAGTAITFDKDRLRHAPDHHAHRGPART